MAVSPYVVAARDREVAAINITPLVDVMLVLLTIFMVATPVLARSIDLRLSQSRQMGDVSEPRALLVDAAGTLTLDGVPVTTDGLTAVLGAAVRRDARTHVRIDASADADYQAFAVALAAVRRSGAQHIALAP